MKAELLMMKGLVSGMSEEQKEKVDEACEDIRKTLDKYGQEIGMIAIGLVGGEIASGE